MYGSYWKLSVETAMLAMEAQAVIGLRLAKLATGGVGAQREAQRMVSEKVFAAAEVAMIVAAGGTTLGVVEGYRRKVHANFRRLSRPQT